MISGTSSSNRDFLKYSSGIFVLVKFENKFEIIICDISFYSVYVYNLNLHWNIFDCHLFRFTSEIVRMANNANFASEISKKLE